MNLRLLVFQRDVARENVRILQCFGHRWMTATVIEDDTTNESRVSLGSVLHLHDFDHVEIRWFAWFVEGENSIDDNLVWTHTLRRERTSMVADGIPR